MTQLGSFSPDRLAMIAAIEREHFWFLGRKKLIFHLLQRFQVANAAMIIDIGCGTGYNLDSWKVFAQQVIGIDRLTQLINQEQKNGNIQQICSDVTVLPIKDASANVTIALDVLEHVPDHQTLIEVNRCLSSNGLLFMTVPAMKCLWSFRDEAAGHKRRYSKESLRNLLESAGMEILYLNYYQFFLFPIVFLSRKLGRKNKSFSEKEECPGKIVNTLFSRITSLEIWFAKIGMVFPWGSSLVAVARKVE